MESADSVCCCRGPEEEVAIGGVGEETELETMGTETLLEALAEALAVEAVGGVTTLEGFVSGVGFPGDPPVGIVATETLEALKEVAGSAETMG